MRWAWLYQILVVPVLAIPIVPVSCPASAASPGTTILYVDDDAPLEGDGTGWPTAFRFLQDALAAARTPGAGGGADEIHVAQGIYRPDQDEAGNVTPGDQEATFALSSGMALMGGYAGLGAPDPDERDIELYETILTGDLAGDDEPGFINYDENSFHVVTGTDVGETAVLDGFTITAGNAESPSADDRDYGGGLRMENAQAFVCNCVFTANRARSGASIFMRESSPVVADCVFSRNRAISLGGAMYIASGSGPTIDRCAFYRNESLFSAAGIYIGLYNLSVQLRDCWFIQNTAERSTAVECTGDVLIERCSFLSNTATDGSGAALFANYEALVVNCTFIGNTATMNGGAVRCQAGSMTFMDCDFMGNEAGGNGGAFWSTYVASPTLVGCSFTANRSAGDYGGGALCHAGLDLEVVNCSFSGNAARTHHGGAVCYRTPTMPTLRLRLSNCLILDNEAVGYGGGIYLLTWDNSVIVTNCTMAGNTDGEDGGAIFIDSGGLSATNCVLYSNAGPSIGGDGAVVRYSDVEGGYAGEGNIDADPLFRDPANGDFRLSSGSPCIDAADNTALPYDELDLDDDGDIDEPIPIDLDWNPRLIDDPNTEDTGHGEPPIVDMGAYEFQPPECPADFDGDGDVDTADLLFLLGAWGTPDGDLDGDGDTNTFDLLVLLAAWGDCP